MNHTERMRGIAKAIVSMLALAWGMGTAIAQVQPAVADNNQDEQINLSRELGDEGTVKILRSGDKSETNEYVTRVYRLEHANPFEVLPYLRTLVTPEKGRVATAFNPDPETGQMRAWVQVSVPSFLVTSVDAAVASYDVAGFKSSPGDVRISYRTQHRSAQEVADFIRQADLSGDGSITADPNTNSLYLVDSPSDFARVISTIQFFDVQIPEVDVELQLVELTEVDQTVLGLDWDAWKLSVGGRYEETAQWSRTHPDGEEVQRSNSQSISWLGAMGATAMADFLNYMIDRGKARMVANTHLVVLNGETGRFSSLTEVPEYNYNYDAAQDLSELDEELDSPANPKYEGLQLRIRPGIAMGCTRLDLTIDLRSPVAVGKTGNPIYSEQHVETSLICSEGALYKIGGLKRGVVATETKRIPLLGSIPGLRWLFMEQTDVVRETELFLFVRPTWFAPELSAVKAMAGSEALQEFPYTVEGILSKNPNIGVNEADRRVLDQYFGNQ